MALNLQTQLLLLTFVVLVVYPTGAHAFGAGKAFRYTWFSPGDIENILSEIVKASAHVGGGGGLLGFAQSVVSAASGGSKFDRNDIKRVYFGNWLRDYSQAMDIAGLSKLTADTLIMVLGVLGFMTFGYASDEFEVTAERVGVYLPDMLRKEGDARTFHPKLRPPVDDRELEIDRRTGMKNYMATENAGWDTSTAHIRRTLRAAIDHGRRAGGREGAELYEAYRLLGTGLHTLEDLLAHSNWCEIGLRKLGHSEVFCHVGDNVFVDSPNGRAPPLVTGTFGSADFLHSLMGEATDKISQASVTDLSAKMEEAKNSEASSKLGTLKSLLGKIGGGGNDEKLSHAEALEQKSQAYHFNPDNICPPEVQRDIWDLIKWRDGVMRDVSRVIENIPGLSDLVEELSNALNECKSQFSPILSQTMSTLGEGSQAVIDTEDQYEVFNNPHASDPSHSILSKDHFGLILNEPAGKIAQVVVIHSLGMAMAIPDQYIDEILEAFHHPYYASGRSAVQNDMFRELQKWFDGLGGEQREVLQRLTKASVREGKNKRIGSEDHDEVETGYGGHSHARPQQGRPSGGQGYQQQSHSGSQGYQHSSVGGQGHQSHSGGQGYQQSQSGGYASGGRQDYGGGRQDEGYGQQSHGSGGGGYSSSGRQEYSSSGGGGYSSNEHSYSGGYGSHSDHQDRQQSGGGYRTNQSETESYGSIGRQEHGRQEVYSSGGGRHTSEQHTGDHRHGRNEYDSGRQESYGGDRHESSGQQGYSGGFGQTQSQDQYTSSTYGGGRQESGYGQSQTYGGGGYQPQQSHGNDEGYLGRRQEGHTSHGYEGKLSK
ncbi:Het-C-domain-containing protein [Flagelloscypha sp. PMI_526]|nr:Het-C-domain-containing protein [Flagelloscypha sp. PMI_526]